MPVGNGKTGYLMRCTQEDFDEENKADLAAIKDREDAMKRQLNSSADGRYGKVEIEQNKPVIVPAHDCKEISAFLFY